MFDSDNVEEQKKPHLSDLLIPTLAKTKLTLKVLNAYLDYDTDV